MVTIFERESSGPDLLAGVDVDVDGGCHAGGGAISVLGA